MEGEILWRENIKPTSPTPLDKRIHKLSLLDQIGLPIFVPLVLYYTGNNNNNILTAAEFISQTTQVLRQSLSATLSLFYPLAGRIRDRLSVDCNDQGVSFVVVKFNESLSNFLKKPDPEVCPVHAPGHAISLDEPGPGSELFMVQVNYFDCGGIAIGSIFSHKVVDGATIATFMKAWATAAASGGGGEALVRFTPNYTAKSQFPHNESMPMEVHLSSHLTKLVKIGKSTVRRYVFDASAISKIRAQLLLSPSLPDETLERRPSRVEAVSALLWKCFMHAASKNSGGSMCFISHSVNMRRRANPPFPEFSFGNFIWPTTESTMIMNSQTHGDIKFVFSKVRSALNKVDQDFVSRMEGEEGYPGYYKNIAETWGVIPKENANVLSFTSWCSFGLYDADFGWGKPAWISRCDVGNSNNNNNNNNNAESPFINLVWLTDTRDGDGIEAWLTMDQRYYDEFDKIKELSDLASIDPSPLDI